MLRSTSCWPNAPSHSVLVGPTTAAASPGMPACTRKASRYSANFDCTRSSAACTSAAADSARAVASSSSGGRRMRMADPTGGAPIIPEMSANRNDCSRAYNPAREADPYRCSGGRVPGRGGRSAAAGAAIRSPHHERAHHRRHRIPVSGRIGRYSRRAHRGRRPGVGRVGADHRCPRTRRGPWVHRSALAFRLLAADRRKRREQNPAGRDHRGHRRERFSRAAETDRRAGLERFHGLLLGNRARQDVGQPAFVCRPGPGPRVRDGQRRARSENGGASSVCRASWPMR